MNSRFTQKLFFTLFVIIALVVHTRWPSVLKSDILTFVLLILAVLPWLDSIVKVAEFPGGWKIEFRELKVEVARQEEIINALVKYSMSASIFHHLCGIALLHTYRYQDNDGNRREFYFLRDNGFIAPKPGLSFLDFGPDIDGKNVVELAEPTPIGWECIKLRKAEVPSNMRTDVKNLRVQLETL